MIDFCNTKCSNNAKMETLTYEHKAGNPWKGIPDFSVVKIWSDALWKNLWSLAEGTSDKNQPFNDSKISFKVSSYTTVANTLPEQLRMTF